MSWIARSIVTVSVWTLTACTSLPPQPPAPPPLQASLRQPCPLLDPPRDGQAGTVLRTLVDWASLYRECAARVAALIEALP